MKTEDLISALAADGRQTGDLGRSLLIALIGGATVAGMAFFSTLGFRHDIDSAMHTMRFCFKFLVTLSLAASAISVVWRIGRPGLPLALPAWLLIIPILLLVASVAIEMMVVPEADWTRVLYLLGVTGAVVAMVVAIRGRDDLLAWRWVAAAMAINTFADWVSSIPRWSGSDAFAWHATDLVYFAAYCCFVRALLLLAGNRERTSVIDRMIVYRDNQHLTATFAAALAPVLEARLWYLLAPE